MNHFTKPFNLQAWIEEHRQQLKPPVCNKQIFEADDFIVMVVGGPNKRTDYHYNQTPELFYQLEGSMVLGLINEGEFIDMPINEGEIFLLPPKMLHAPRRSANSVGLVVEQKRAPGMKDALHWYCENCHHPLYQEAFTLDNIEKDLPVVFANFYQSEQHRTCDACGTVMANPQAK